MQYVLLRALAAFFKCLPWSVLRCLANILGLIFWALAPSRRKLATEAVAKHLRLPLPQAKRIARQSFKENVLSFLEICQVGKFNAAQDVSVVHTPEVLEQIKQEANPIVFATAHLGSWELIPGLAAAHLQNREAMVVVRSQNNLALNRLVEELRGVRGMQILDRNNASKTVIPKLRAGGYCGFLVDHNTAQNEAIFLPFLQDTAAVARGPANIALRVKAAVYPMFLLRDGKGGYILHLLPPLQTKNLTGSVHERIHAIAVFYTNAVAAMVRQYPEQWLWLHRRWKTRETPCPTKN